MAVAGQYMYENGDILIDMIELLCKKSMESVLRATPTLMSRYSIIDAAQRI